MEIINGIGVGDNIVIQKAYVINNEPINFDDYVQESVEAESKKLAECIKVSKQQINNIKQKSKDKLSDEELQVFDAHLLILDDPEIITSINNLIQEGKDLLTSINEVLNNFIVMFENMDDEYFKQRASDIKDIKKRLLTNASGHKMQDLSAIDEECIIVSDDLTPSQTAQLNKDYVKAFVTALGGKTSHACIMAKSMGIPALVGCGSQLINIKDDDLLIVDTINDQLIFDADIKTINDYQIKQEEVLQRHLLAQSYVNKPSITKDGVNTIIAANIGTPKDAYYAKECGCEAIGLFRSEFLYMDKTALPSEEEQFNAYKEVLSLMDNKQVIVRTLDIGGDKELPYLHIGKEENPFLGYRAIRICLDQQDIFKTQLRALLRASSYGKLGIMFPMIATLDELRNAKAILESVKDELRSENISFDEEIEIGMMIEVPSACILADKFAQEVDFFSIGTNDLIQYTMACDRGSEKVSYLYQPFNPSVLKMIQLAIDAAHKHNIWCGMCGEMASDPMAQLILLAMGLDEFSMSSSNILASRQYFSEIEVYYLQQYLPDILEQETGEDVINYIKKLQKREQ